MKVSPEKAAKTAGLRYVHDEMPGIHRQSWGKGFSYLLPNGDRLESGPDKERIEALVIPPNWQDVWICTDPNGHLQATGRDEKGRKQYRYHSDWMKLRNLQKFDRMVPFGLALPTLRAQTQADLSLPNLSKRKVTAAIVQLLDQTLIRIGNAQYAKRNKSYGLTTLRDKHVDISEDQEHIDFHFRGKSGVEHHIEIDDPKLAEVVKKCQDIPGYELFQYYDEVGDRQVVDSGDVNDYLKEITGEDFTAKDFRTWAGTNVATDTLYQLGEWEKETDAKRNVVTAIKAAATRLGNRPATCRKYYVHPTVPENYISGELIRQLADALKQAKADKKIKALEESEKTVLVFLESI